MRILSAPLGVSSTGRSKFSTENRAGSSFRWDGVDGAVSLMAMGTLNLRTDIIAHSWFAATMKWFHLAGVLALGSVLVSCGEKETEVAVPGDQIPSPSRNSVKIETHDARPEEPQRIVQSSNKAIINWNEFSIDDTEFELITPGPNSETIMRIPGKLSDYPKLPKVTSRGRVTLVDEAGDSLEIAPTPSPVP